MKIKGRIFDGNEIIENATVSFSTESGNIDYIDTEFKSNPSNRLGRDNITFLPGMIDTHMHLFGTQERSLESWVLTSDIILTANSINDLSHLINAGFTTVRTMGDKVSLELSKAEKSGIINSPAIISSGFSIAETGGDDDPKRFPLDFAKRVSYSYYADGPWECVKAVRKNIRAGAQSIKAYASSSFVGGGKIRDELSIEELKAIAKESKKYGVQSAAHAYGESAIQNVVDAGFSSIEHGLGLTENQAEEISSKKIFYTPTLSVYKAQREGSNPYRESFIKKHIQNEVKIADTAGIKIAAGTDFVGSTEEKHGNNYLEAVYLADVIGNKKALQAITSVAAQCIGATNAGCITKGYVADIIGVYGNPLEDIQSLRPENVAVVIKRGKIIKNTSNILFDS